MRGAVRIEKNPNLCYVDTIDWSLITTGNYADFNYIDVSNIFFSMHIINLLTHAKKKKKNRKGHLNKRQTFVWCLNIKTILFYIWYYL